MRNKQQLGQTEKKTNCRLFSEFLQPSTNDARENGKSETEDSDY